MALGVGQAVAAGLANANSSTTAAVTTQASGSNFKVTVAYIAGGTVTVTDSKSNTYNRIGSVAGPVTSFGESIRLDDFICENGTGGASHTFTATVTNGFPSMSVLEITGAASSSSLITSSATNTDASSPYQAPAIDTTGFPDSILVSAITGDLTSETDYTAGNSFTIAAQISNINTNWSVAQAYRIVASAGSYQDSWTNAGIGNGTVNRLFAFKPAAAGGTIYTRTPFESPIFRNRVIQ